MLKVILFMARGPDHYSFNLLPPKISLINPSMARAPNDSSFDPLPTKNISKVVKLTHFWPMHLNINHLIVCNPRNVEGYLIIPFMARAPDDQSFNPLPTKNVLNVVSLTHSLPEHLNLFI